MTWADNIAVIEQRWPALAARLAAQNTRHAAFDGKTLRYRGVQVVSAYDRQAEAAAQLDAMQGPFVKAPHCYGIGLGDLPERFKFTQCRVVLPNLEIARASFEFADHVDWMRWTGVELVAADAVKWSTGPFAAVAMECWLADRQGYELRDRLFLYINERVNVGLLEANKQRHFDNWHANKAAMHYPSCVLFGVAPRSSAVAVAAGPSLTSQLDWLRTCGKRPIVACTNALRALQGAGIKPDVAVQMDASPVQVAHLEGLDLDALRIPLVYGAESAPEVAAAWKGALLRDDELYLGGTVLHTCVDLAVKMGAADVTIIGFDCCTPEGKSYAASAGIGTDRYATGPLAMWTVDGNGRDVMTQFSMTQWHRRAEDYIAQHPEVRFYKRGRAGVPLRGATWSD